MVAMASRPVTRCDYQIAIPPECDAVVAPPAGDEATHDAIRDDSATEHRYGVTTTDWLRGEQPNSVDGRWAHRDTMIEPALRRRLGIGS